ncbi:hypothetical protein [Geobacillus sp. B4113_201601]|uniref:hypothetical protein n=1 Tax=Geobacillus sp. B4113_201601 TaxID=1586290 RepID=UPI0007825CA7|nr:hypothetical protein [Geobacillus sp. B4113_201601]KYD29945.1 hypothetical protein B4113_1180 [Geobacillus sp. B4113_201601]
MRKHTIIEHHQFKQILQYRPAVTEEADRNRLKMDMLQSIIQAIGEKWHRMKQETKSALEYLCFLSVERGFVYAGSYHVGERYDIDSSTVRRYLLFLERKGVIRRIWRSSIRQNGRGKAVIFFTVHPYFKQYWQTLFFSHDDEQAHAQAESVENTRIVEGLNEQSSTLPYDLPNSDINKNNNHLNVNHSKKGTFVKFVSKEVNRIANGLFNAEMIKSAWNRVTLAFRKAVKRFGDIINHADRKRVAIATFVSLKAYFMQRKGQMQTDEICALAYSIARAQFEQIGHSRQPEKDEIESVEKKPIRTEALPDWFAEHQKRFERFCADVKKQQQEKVSPEEIEELRRRLAQYA